MENNSIERKIEIKAAPAKVWDALTDYKKFSQWFGVKLDGPFIAGKTTTGINNFKELQMAYMIEKIEPKTFFSYKWTPFPIDKSRDYSKEEPTLVEFTLKEIPTGTQLTVVESGFNQIPQDRRAEAFRMHTGGWDAQLENIQEYVLKNS